MTQPPDTPSPAAPAPARRRRLRGRSWLVIFAGFGLLFSCLPRGPQHAALRSLLVALLRNQTQREVHIGEVSGVLWFGARAAEVMIADEGGFGPDGRRVTASADGVRLRYRLWSLLTRPRDPLAAIAGVDVANPQIRVRRQDGKWELVDLFKPHKKKPKRPFSFRGRISVGPGKLVLVDDKAGLRQDLDLQRAFASFGRGGQGKLDVIAALPGLAERVQASGSLTVEPFATRLDVAVAGCDLAAARGLLALAPAAVRDKLDRAGGVVAGGMLDLRGPLAVAVKEPVEGGRKTVETGFRLTFDAHDVTAGSRQAALSEVNGRVTAALGAEYVASRGARATVGFDGFAARLGGSRVRLDGTAGYRGPREAELDLRLRSDELRPGELAALAVRLAPAAQRARLLPVRGLTSSGATSCDLRVRGTVAALQVSGWLRPVGLVWAAPAGSRAPVEAAGVSGGMVRLSLARVSRAAGVFGLAGTVGVEGVGLAARRAGSAELRIDRLDGEVRAAPDLLVLRGLTARLGGAAVRADGSLRDLARERRLQMEVAVAGLAPMELAGMVPAAYRPRASSGLLSAKVRLSGPLRDLAVVGDAQVPRVELPQGTHLGGAYRFDLRLGKRPVGRVAVRDGGFQAARLGADLTRVTADLRLSPDGVAIETLTALYDGRPVRAAGSLSYDLRRFDLGVQTPGLAVAQALAALPQRGVSGRGLAAFDLRLRGGRERFQVVGRASLPRLELPDATIFGGELRPDLWVTPRLRERGLWGSLGIRALAVSTPLVPAPLRVEQAGLQFAGDAVSMLRLVATVGGDRVRVDGTVTGLRTTRRLDLRVDLPKLHEATRAAVAESFARIAGRLRDPLQAAKLRQAARQIQTFRLDEPAAAALHLVGPPRHLQIAGDVTAPGLTLLERQGPVRLAGGVGLALVAGPRPEDLRGSIRLRGVSVRTDQLPLPAEALTGQLVLAGGRAQFGADGLTGRLGGSPAHLWGSLSLRAPVDMDLTVSFAPLRLADLDALTARVAGRPRLSGGDLTLERVRVVGTPRALRIATLAGAGSEPGVVRLPALLRIQLAGTPADQAYEIHGGAAQVDLLVADNHLRSGTFSLTDSTVLAGATGTRVVLHSAHFELAGERVRSGGADASVGGGSLVLTATPPPGSDAVAATIHTTGVSLRDLLPRQAAQLEANFAFTAAPLLEGDFTLSGKLDDLAVGGRLSFGDSLGDPLLADVDLRLLRPAGEAAQVVGGLRLAGGSLPVRGLATPLRNLRGGLSVGPYDVSVEDLTVDVAGHPVRLSGAVYGRETRLYDLRCDLDGLDAGALMADLRLPPKGQPDGAPVDLASGYGLPRLRTPEPVAGTLTLVGPAAQIAVGVDLTVPVVTVDPADAMPNERGLGAAAGRDGPALVRDVHITGSALGSFPETALPQPAELAAALGKLVGLRLAAEPEPAPAPEEPAGPKLMDRFTLALHVEAGGLDLRQAFAFLKRGEDFEQGVLPSIYVHQPGRASLDVLGPAGDPELRGRLVLGRAEIKGVPVRRAVLPFDHFGQVFTFSGAQIAVRDGTLSASGAMRLRAKDPLDIETQLHLEEVDLALLNAVYPAGLGRVDVGGRATGDVALHLAHEVPRARGQVKLTGLRMSGSHLGDGRLGFAVDDTIVTLRDLTLADPDSRGRLRMRGEVGLGAADRIDLDTDVRGFDLARLQPLLRLGAKPDAEVPEVTGRLEFAGRIFGTRQLPLVTGVGSVFLGSYDGRPFSRLALDATQPEGHDDALDLHAELYDPAWRARLSASLTHIDSAAGSADYVVDVSSGALDIRRAVPLLTPAASLREATGLIDLTGHVAGTLRREKQPDGTTRLAWRDAMTGFVELAGDHEPQAPELQLAGVTVDSLAARLELHGEEMLVTKLEAAAGETRVRLQKRPRPNRLVTLDGKLYPDLALVCDRLGGEELCTLLNLPVRSQGYLTGEVTLSPPLAGAGGDATWNATATLASHDLVLGDGKLPDQTVTLRYIPKTASAAAGFVLGGEPHFVLAGADIRLRCELVGETIASSVFVHLTDTEELHGFLLSLTHPPAGRSQQAWQGRLEATLRQVPPSLVGDCTAEVVLTGRRSSPSGSVRLALKGLRTGTAPLRRVPDCEVAIALGSTPGAALRHDEAGWLTLGGHADISRSDKELGHLRLQLRGRGLDLLPYSGWLRPGTELRGRLDACDVMISQSVRHPRVEVLELSASAVGTEVVQFDRLQVRSVAWDRDVLTLGSGEPGVRITDADGLRFELAGEAPLGRQLAAHPLAEHGVAQYVNRDGPVHLELRAEVPALARFAPVMGSVGRLSGVAAAHVLLTGTPANPRFDGWLDAEIPDLSVIHRGAGKTEELTRLINTAIHLRLAERTLTVGQCATTVLPPDRHDAVREARDRGPGSVAIVPGGWIRFDQFDRDRLLENPANLALRARGLAADVGSFSVRQLQLAVELTPAPTAGTPGGVTNQLHISEARALVNGGVVQAGGGIGLRSGRLALSPEYDYNVDLKVPSDRPIPIQIPRVGRVRVAADLHLRSPATGTPVLGGTVKVFGGLVSEDAKAFFERRQKATALRDWPAWPTLAVNIDATQNNRIRTGVPQLQAVLALSARLTGSPRDLELRGDAQITQGSLRATFLSEPIERITARTSKLEVRRNPVTRSFDPYVAFEANAETEFQDRSGGGSLQSDRVHLEVRGGVVPGPERPIMTEWVVTARSDHALPQQQILARLTGRQEFQRAMERGKMQDYLRQEIISAGTQAAFAVAIEPAVEGLRRSLGLDQFLVRVEAGRPVHIQAGKWLVKHLFLSYAIDVQGERGTTQSLRVDYELSGGVRVGVQLTSEPEVRGSAEYHTRF